MAKAEYRSAVRSRRLINEALAELMQEKPLDKITVTDVVTRANLNRGTFYAHYADIQDVVNRRVEDACQTLREALRARSLQQEEHPDPAGVLLQLQKFLEGDITFYRSLLISSSAAAAVEKIRNVFVEYMLEHETDFVVQDKTHYLFDIMFASGGLITMYQDWFNGRLPMTLEQLTERAITVTRSIAEISGS